LVDFDADGKNDILSGSYPGELYLFKGEGGGKFAKSDTLKHADGKPVKVGMAAVVYAQDWDSDGDFDLLVGDIEGQVHLVKNDGSKSKPAFGPASLLQAAGNPIKVSHGDAGPSVADWDGDGNFDLLVGTGAGSVEWFRNTGSNQAPKLAASQTLVAAPAQGEANANAVNAGAKPGTRTKVHATDWNGDGKLDLLVGDFSHQQAAEPVLTEEQQAAKKSKRDAWMKEYQALQQAPLDESKEARQARMKKTADLMAKFKEINAAEAGAQQPPQSQYHGYVWLYLRQAGVAKAD
jgi:hypothetical protein